MQFTVFFDTNIVSFTLLNKLGVKNSIVPSYLIVIYYTNGGNSSGIRYTDLTNIEEIQNVVRKKMRDAGKLDLIAYIYVKPSNKAAEREL